MSLESEQQRRADAELDRYREDAIERIVLEHDRNLAALIASARAEGMSASDEEIKSGHVTWRTAAEYLADREIAKMHEAGWSLDGLGRLADELRAPRMRL
ncbi:MAG: hypothetical protein PHO89_01180 [Methylacidiphilaceae bacterium]|nr:hypothetical protein [Candidatus Methylacidiphilaceae bacterium]